MIYLENVWQLKTIDRIDERGGVEGEGVGGFSWTRCFFSRELSDILTAYDVFAYYLGFCNFTNTHILIAT